MTTNPYYTPSGTPSTGAFAASAAMRAEFDRIQAGFNFLPALTGTNLAVIVAGGVLTTTTGALVLSAAFTLSGGFGVTLSASADVTLTMPAVAGTLATLAGTETLSNKTLVAPALGTPVSGNLSSCTGYPVGSVTGIDAAAETWLVTPSSTNLRAAVATTSTGSGALVFATSPTLVTPALGVATATSINKVAFTAPASAATLTIADGKTLTANASLTLAGTDGKTLTLSNSLTFAGTDATVITFPTTSATIARTDAAQTFSGAQTFGTQSTTRGTVVLANTAAGSKAATLQSSNSATAATTITLPPDAGSNAYYLQTDGSGNTIWAPGTASFTPIESKTVSGTPSFVEFKNLTIEDGILYIAGLTITAGTATLRIEFSTDNGSTYFGTIYNLLNGVLNQTALWAQFPINGMKIGLVTMPIYNSNTAFSASGPPSNPTASAANAVGSFLSFGSSVTAIRVSTSASTFVNGSVIALMGRA